MKNKFYSTLLAITLALGTLPGSVLAETDNVHLYQPSRILAGMTLKIDGWTHSDEFEYQSMTSDSADGGTPGLFL